MSSRLNQLEERAEELDRLILISDWSILSSILSGSGVRRSPASRSSMTRTGRRTLRGRRRASGWRWSGSGERAR